MERRWWGQLIFTRILSTGNDISGMVASLSSCTLWCENCQLNNKNILVTNSRDTQEIGIGGFRCSKHARIILARHVSWMILIPRGLTGLNSGEMAKQQQFQKRSLKVWEGKPTDEKNKEDVGGHNCHCHQVAPIVVCSISISHQGFGRCC